MTPLNTKEGESRTIFFSMGNCSLGSILVARSERGVCCILIGEDPAGLAKDLRKEFPEANLVNEPGHAELVAHVAGLIEKPGAGTELPLDVRGTAFQQLVWDAIGRIPSGSTASYADIAREIRVPGAVRAVAQACAANVLAVAIPCHRVIRRDGSLSGYRWGVQRKRALLAREAHA